jgi:hypothetical protein
MKTLCRSSLFIVLLLLHANGISGDAAYNLGDASTKDLHEKSVKPYRYEVRGQFKGRNETGQSFGRHMRLFTFVKA